MKGFKFGFFVALTALPMFAGAVGVSRIIPGTNTETVPTVDFGLRIDTENSGATRASTARATAASNESTTRTAVTRNVSRTVVPEVAETTRASNRSAAISRSQTNTDARSNLEAAIRTSGRSTRTEAAGINANPAVRRMGLTLRPSTAEVGGRAIMDSGAQTGSNMASEIKNLQSSRIATVRKRDEDKLDPAAIADAKNRMEQTAELNKSCQEQYNDCMDQFCAVIDANQKRCSCSANLAKYAKVEKAVKDANTELNEVAQNIRYVGLSADEISAIMSATEAEEAMTGTTDTTENRALLAQIEQMIINPKSTSAAALSTDSYGLLDIDLDFSSSELDNLFNLDFLGNGNTGTFSNLRGADLYNAAKKRCNTIINQCKEVGATSQQITGNYDLAIDKDCIAYEQGLNKMNETLVSNVRSATRMLQKARLAVMQNQNIYDARECIGALENCMTDDMVCGEDYKKCLDPTKKFIDENGNVVLGKNVNYIQKFMERYNNANVNNSYLSSAYTTPISDDCANDNYNDGRCIVKYLLTKIGTQQSATAEGLCRPVLDKCRAYTYDTRGNYNAYNDIVVNYIQRAMVNIKAAQYKIVSDYASTCLTDIATCYNDQVSQLTSWSATAAASSIYNIMRGACRNVALTCGYAVFSADAESCSDDSTCIESISEIFYQSLLCPDNSTYELRQADQQTIDENNTDGGWANKLCRCQDGFVTFNGACLPACENGGIYTSVGTCTAGAECHTIANARTATSSDSIDSLFWGGRCACTNNMYFYRNKCRKCPSNSVYISDLMGDIFVGQCKCNQGFTPSPNKLCCGDAEHVCKSDGNYDVLPAPDEESLM